MIAALYVQRGGCYWDLPGVDPWDEARDARLYDGPWPVVAHPPCERWGRFAKGSPLTSGNFTVGDDGGCFKAALASVRKWGGLLEHPEGSLAWRTFGLSRPGRAGAWYRADWTDGFDGWTCCIDQGAYGHRARKRTWLYAHGVELPSMKWGKTPGVFDLVGGMGFHSKEERARFKADPQSVPWALERQKKIRAGIIAHMSKSQRAATPHPFRDLLISIAETANPKRAAA